LALFQLAFELRKNTDAVLGTRRTLRTKVGVKTTAKPSGAALDSSAEKEIKASAKRPSFVLDRNEVLANHRQATAVFRNVGGTAYGLSVAVQRGHERTDVEVTENDRIETGGRFKVALRLTESPVYVVLQHRDRAGRPRTQVFGVEVGSGDSPKLRVFER
ncbi:MAG: hypothetical protein K0U93_28285, partial [Gammaproteobacteria bacterium]|nr:hypothetical protein [Gammaproteobacteria bacterium]